MSESWSKALQGGAEGLGAHLCVSSTTSYTARCAPL